jgi:hypothetical protein
VIQVIEVLKNKYQNKEEIKEEEKRKDKYKDVCSMCLLRKEEEED